MKKRWTHRSRLHGRNITAVATDDSCTGSKYIRFLYAVVGRSAAGIIGRGMSCPKKWQSIRNTDSDYFGACAGNSDRTGARSVIARRNYNRQSKIPQMFHCIKKKFFLPGRKCGPSADRNIYKVKRIRIFLFSKSSRSLSIQSGCFRFLRGRGLYRSEDPYQVQYRHKDRKRPDRFRQGCLQHESHDHCHHEVRQREWKK